MTQLRMLLLAFFFTVMSTAQAETGPVLFKDYLYGMADEGFSNNSAYYNCSEEFSVNALCLDDVSFLSTKFTIGLLFQEKRLQSVVLYTDFSEPTYLKTISALIKSFQISSMQSKNKNLDIIELNYKKTKEANLRGIINSFESNALSEGLLTYTFLEIQEYKNDHAINLVDLIRKLPNSSRQVDFTVGEEQNETLLVLSFTLPALKLQQLQDIIRKPIEKF
ncbi:hypothetical protein [Marinomonas primoryensis]|jgi:hypothetical protein|uniref:hypothetical protein n=1 Tax=Marinomonas primoryensis TaxID=178399 RepID=UPI0030DCFBE8|tara:strand:- start:253 stop:915 length:663 start_codon:yes stop_codon:yes gene_type:complete